MRPLERSKIKRILVVSLTNIGDVILTLPVVDILKRDFPSSEISISIGPKAATLFSQNPHLKNVYIYDKKQSTLKTIAWMFELRREKFDLVVDLRNSAIPFLIGARNRTPVDGLRNFEGHMRDKHLSRLNRIHPVGGLPDRIYALFLTEKDQRFVHELLIRELEGAHPYVVMAPGSAYKKKRWPLGNFAQLGDELQKFYGVKIVCVGDQRDREIVETMAQQMKVKPVNLAGMTTLIQTAGVIKDAALVISNDSAPLHLSSYLDRPTLALFGPSDPAKYGPWGRQARYLKADSLDADGNADITTINVDMVFQCINYNDGKFSFTV